MPIDSILEFKRAMHFKIEAKKDEIFIVFRRINGKMNYRINGGDWLSSFESMKSHVKALESQIDYSGDRT